MCNVVLFPKHRLYRCVIDRPDRHVCLEGRCMYCEGGLSYCITCKGGKAELPTECPQEPMDALQRQMVERGLIDFVGGMWVITENALPIL